MNIEQAVLAMIAALEAEQIPYMLVGSFSTNFYGIPRSTEDGDLVIELGSRTLTGLRQRLAPVFRFDPQVTFESVTGTLRTIAHVSETSLKIELFRLSNDLHDQERFRRRKVQRYFDQQISLPTAEDVIVTKLFWAKNAGRGKDRDDVRDVVAVQGDNLDWAYIRSWTEQHGTSALLVDIRRSIPPI